MKKKCRLCKSTFTGRSDKIFCTVRCKSTYHTKLRAVTKTATFAVDESLHRNRSILLEIMGKDSYVNRRIHRSQLDKTNFKYSFVTSYYVNTKGKTINYVYDFWWYIFSDSYLMIGRSKHFRSE